MAVNTDTDTKAVANTANIILAVFKVKLSLKNQ